MHYKSKKKESKTAVLQYAELKSKGRKQALNNVENAAACSQTWQPQRVRDASR